MIVVNDDRRPMYLWCIIKLCMMTMTMIVVNMMMMIIDDDVFIISTNFHDDYEDCDDCR